MASRTPDRQVTFPQEEQDVATENEAQNQVRMSHKRITSRHIITKNQIPNYSTRSPKLLLMIRCFKLKYIFKKLLITN